MTNQEKAKVIASMATKFSTDPVIMASLYILAGYVRAGIQNELVPFMKAANDHLGDILKDHLDDILNDVQTT